MAVKLLALVLPLGLDTFAVAAALGAAGLSTSARTRVSLLMTAFEAGMPLIGVALGAGAGRALGSLGAYVAAAIVLAVGVHALLGEDDDGERLRGLRDARGVTALALGLSVSLDEFAIGFTLGVLRLPVLLVVGLIAVQAYVASRAGMRLGARLNERARENAERLAGVALIALGIALAAERLLG